MPTFDDKTLDNDQDGLAVLAAVLHPTAQARVEAVRCGQARLAQARSPAQAMASTRNVKMTGFASAL